MFIIGTYILNQQTISSNNKFATLINISGKQRMLSQKLIVLSSSYLQKPTSNIKQQLQQTIQEILDNHHFIISNVYTPKIQKILFYDGLDKELKNYIKLFNKIITTQDKKSLLKAFRSSQTLLIKLDQVVKEYEQYSHQQLTLMSRYEFIIMMITLFMLLLEVIFIYRPAAKQIEQNEETLKEKIIEQTKQLQKNMDIISKHIIFSKTNPYGIITEVSDAFCEISGYTKEELIGKSHNIVRHPNNSKSFFKYLWETLIETHNWKGEIRNIKKNGEEYWVEANITGEYDDDGNLIGYMAIRYDITPQKMFEEQSIHLLQTEKLATLGEMIGNIAHQWRQPLSAISTTASSINVQYEFGILNYDELPTYTANIIDKVTYLSDTIDTFRDFIKNDKVFQEVTLQKEIEHAINIVIATVKDNQIDFSHNLNQIDEIKLKLVKGELPQVIVNIINNAKDVLIERQIDNPTINLKLIKQNEQQALVTIEDNAGGIPEDIIGRIFEPYFTTKHKSQGTGLGLHMSYKIINESLGGNLYVENNDKGAVFYITLPLTSKEEA